MRFELTILGCNSAIPAYDRNPTAQVLNIQENLFLIDCGEGTQIQMSKFHIKRGKINQIFISHLHGDHVLGLVGLLNSYALGGRTTPIDLFGPKDLEEFVTTSMRLMQNHSTFPLHFHEVDTEHNQLVFENNLITVHSIPLKHRIPTTGYLFKEKAYPLNIRPEKITEHQIHYSHIKAIKAGADYNDNGRIIPNAELTLPAMPTRSYAYCSDTMYKEDIIPIIKGVDLLYHETTFLHEELELAIRTQHSTARQAAQIAQQAKVGKLITGHYSSRYEDLEVVRVEASQVFSNTVIGKEGEVYSVAFKQKN